LGYKKACEVIEYTLNGGIGAQIVTIQGFFLEVENRREFSAKDI
jgi:hypothetical protein